jgi:predicted  nucleic acid-binding Zn-ribbon protein
MTKAIDEYKSPGHKIIAMLHAGRDKLRKKYSELRENLRTAENQVRAVEKSRAMWRRRAEAAESELSLEKKMPGPSMTSPSIG